MNPVILILFHFISLGEEQVNPYWNTRKNECTEIVGNKTKINKHVCEIHDEKWGR